MVSPTLHRHYDVTLVGIDLGRLPVAKNGLLRNQFEPGILHPQTSTPHGESRVGVDVPAEVGGAVVGTEATGAGVGVSAGTAVGVNRARTACSLMRLKGILP